MTLAFDLPDCKPSLLARLDPRWKLAGILWAALALALVKTLGVSLAGLGGALLLIALARVPPGWYLRRVSIASVMFVLFLIWLPLVVREKDATLDLGIITLSLTGLERLAVLAARFVGMISLILVLLATAPLPDIFKAAHALRIPGVLIQLVLLSYRYVFLLGEEFARLRTALRVRGFRGRADLHSYRTIGQVAGTLLVRSAERSERVGQAMRCRGFEGRFRTLHDFRTRFRDVFAFALMASCASLLLAWDWFAR